MTIPLSLKLIRKVGEGTGSLVSALPETTAGRARFSCGAKAIFSRLEKNTLLIKTQVPSLCPYVYYFIVFSGYRMLVLDS